jgi:hypothetical protein
VSPAELATGADVASVLAEVRALRDEVRAIRASLPPRFVPLKDAAELLACDPRTITAMGERGEIIIRRCGRRIVVDAGSLRPTDPATVARLVREARGL